MSITLYVSSYKCRYVNPGTVLNSINHICKIHKTFSNVESNGYIVQEVGFSIQVFDIDNITFKENVWEPLKILLDLKCAFVKKDGEYMGCILNWPNVFKPSVCSKL